MAATWHHCNVTGIVNCPQQHCVYQPVSCASCNSALFHEYLQFTTCLGLSGYSLKGQQILKTCLARLELDHIPSIVLDSQHMGGLQQQACLGNNEDLLEYMRDKSITAMTTQDA